MRFVRHLFCPAFLAAAAQSLAAGAAPEQSADMRRAAVLAEFRQTAASMRFIFLEPQDGPGRANDPSIRRQYTAVLGLINRADDLPAELLKSADPNERALACLVFGYADKADRVAAVAGLLDDRTETVPYLFDTSTYQPGGRADLRKFTVRLAASSVLHQRFDGLPRGIGAKEFLEWWSGIKDPDELPSEWCFRFQRASLRGQTAESVKERLAKVAPAARARIVAVLHSMGANTDRADFEPFRNLYSEEDVVAALREAFDARTMRTLLTEREPQGFPALEYGPNAISRLQFAIGRRADKFLSRGDAEWISKLAVRDDGVSLEYLLAAIRLDPEKGRPWLEGALSKAADPGARVNLLFELLKIVQPKELLPLIADQFYKEQGSQFDPHPLHFQTEFLTRLTEDFDAPVSKPVMFFLVLDKRFPTVGWTATSAFAAKSELLLGRVPDEKKRFQHLQLIVRTRPERFDELPDERKKNPANAETVDKAVRTFQEFLVKEVEALEKKKGGK